MTNFLGGLLFMSTTKTEQMKQNMMWDITVWLPKILVGKKPQGSPPPIALSGEE